MNVGPALRVKHVCRNVANLARAVQFYREALQFELVDAARRDDKASGARMARMQLGRQHLELIAYDWPGISYPSRRSAADPWFQHVAIVVKDMPAAYAQLCRHPFEPISLEGPQTLPPGSGSVSAFKFRDPDGHPLELIQFPAGIGDPCWRHAAGLFLGIDHTALVATDLDLSLAFYQQLGFQVVSRSRNRGPEQDRLDGLSGVAVEVIGLAAAANEPPRLELLCYRGRPAAEFGMAPDDLAADRTVIEVKGGAGLAQDPTGHRLVLQDQAMNASRQSLHSA
jgi:catechol 2,3-dioxygenase-like lactoylglutathione lyase family enzyme